MQWSVARHDDECPSGRPASPRTSRPTSSTGCRVAAQSRLGALSRASAACPYRIEKGEHPDCRGIAHRITGGYRSKGSRSNRGHGAEISGVQRISLSYVGRRGSCVGCANRNVGMDRTPQLSWRRWIQRIQLDRRAPWRRSTSLRFCRRTCRQTDGLSVTRNRRYSSYPTAARDFAGTGAEKSLLDAPNGGRDRFSSHRVPKCRAISDPGKSYGFARTSWWS